MTTSGGTGTATATLTVGTAPCVYSWDSTPTQTPQTASLQVGWHIVTMTDANGFTSTENVTFLFGNCFGFTSVTRNGYATPCGVDAPCHLKTNVATSISTWNCSRVWLKKFDIYFS